MLCILQLRLDGGCFGLDEIIICCFWRSLSEISSLPGRFSVLIWTDYVYQEAVVFKLQYLHIASIPIFHLPYPLPSTHTPQLPQVTV